MLDDGEQQQRVAIVWHSPLPWIGKPAFVCPVCNHDCYCLHEKAGVFACRKCHGMSYASRHLYRTVPGVHRVARLRREIGADPRPFTPLPKRPRHHIRFHRVVTRILFEERALLGHLQTVTHDLELFELEMERIFGRAWLFVGHDRLALAAAMDRQAGLCLSRLQS